MKFSALVSVLSSAILLTALVFPSAAQAPNDIRIALIIGNSAYPGNMALANPSNDAKDMAATLRNMGFGVIEVLDGNRAQMMAAIERANKQLQGRQGVGMLFYAGHGLQLDWHNFMVPVDAKLNSAVDVPKQTVDIEVVMKSFQQAGNRMNIVVLDACRDDPFANGKTSSGKGLAPLDAPTGTFLAYATAPGNVAQDGTGRNGLYTSFLLQELQKPTARIEDVFKRVRFAVRKASNGAQIPWETTSLEEDFVFNSGIKKIVEQSNNVKNQQFDSEKTDWNRIKESKNVNDFFAFLQKYPNGFLSLSASSAIEHLKPNTLHIYSDKNGVLIDSKQAIYRVNDEIQYVRKDGYTNIETGRPTRQVLSITNGVVLHRGNGKTTERGEELSTGSGVLYDPPRPYFPDDGRLTIGKKWGSRISAINKNGEKGWLDEERKVLAFEEIKVAAGTFKAFKVEWVGTDSWGWQSKTISWRLPDFGYPLKSENENRFMRGSQSPNRWTEEAVSIKRGAV